MNLFIGSQAEEYRGLLNIRYPMEHGIVKDWNDKEKIWHDVYKQNKTKSFYLFLVRRFKNKFLMY